MLLAILTLVTEGLKTFNLVYADQPAAERKAAWESLSKLLAPVRAVLDSASGKVAEAIQAAIASEKRG